MYAAAGVSGRLLLDRGGSVQRVFREYAGLAEDLGNIYTVQDAIDREMDRNTPDGVSYC